MLWPFYTMGLFSFEREPDFLLLLPTSAPRSRLAISSHRRNEMQAWPEHKSLNLVRLFSTIVLLLLFLLHGTNADFTSILGIISRYGIQHLNESKRRSFSGKKIRMFRMNIICWDIESSKTKISKLRVISVSKA